MEALQNSLIIAFTSAGTGARSSARWRQSAWSGWRRATAPSSTALFAAAIVVPGVVIGIATLVALVEVFGVVNPAHRRRLARRPAAEARHSATARSSPRTGCSRMALVTMIVKARIASLGRDIVEASSDLYATPLDDLPADRAAADHAVDPGGLPARLHLLLRRFHHRLLRGGLEDDAADLRLRLDPPRRDAGDHTQSRRWCWIASLAPTLIARFLMREKTTYKPTGETP